MIMRYKILVLFITFLLVSCSNDVSRNSIDDGGCVNLEIMIHGVIYTHDKTYKIDEVDFVKEGTITSTVNDTEIPYKNDQSNFGKGYEYDVVSDRIIYVKYSEDTVYEFLRAN